MAFSGNNHALLLLFLLPAVLVPYQASCDSHQSTINSLYEPKYVHLTFYQHETVNKTAYLVTDGMPSTVDLVPFGSPFGSLVVFHDTLTATEDPDSEVVGEEEGTFITSRFDGSVGITTCIFNLNLPNYKGTISIVGATHVSVPSDHPIIGGTGDFLFVQGYGKSTLVSLEGLTAIYRVDLHLYWPSYAAPKSSN
ncbi:dirigent protein 1-like [Ipomoea triloba]|uniref:dirigent protein 1-like n=1 Tax=Ipomoea triloba TaxID=35885 RepID=UPI00125D89B8|nr:dirigent protein 1-like [Ipomoea triloba]